MKYLDGIDIFGSSFEFSMFGSPKFHTLIGRFLSVSLYILLISFIIVFGLDLIHRKNPKVITDIQEPKIYDSVRITPENFTFAWRLEDKDSKFVDATGLLFPKVYFHFYKRNQTTRELQHERGIKLEPEICSNKTVKDPIFLGKKDISKWYCIDFIKNNETLGGFWDADFVKYFEVKFFICPDNNPNSPNCTSIKKLKKVTSGKNRLYFSCLYPEHFFEPNKQDNPLHYNYVNYYNTISLNLQKIDRIFLKRAYLIDDKAYMLKEPKESKQISVKKFQNSENFKPDELFQDKSLPTYVYIFVIYFSQTKEKYYRTYMKAQELAAIVGGFMEILFVIGRVLSAFYNKYVLNLRLIDELFDYREEEPLSRFSMNELNKDKNLRRREAVKNLDHEKILQNIDLKSLQEAEDNTKRSKEKKKSDKTDKSDEETIVGPALLEKGSDLINLNPNQINPSSKSSNPSFKAVDLKPRIYTRKRVSLVPIYTRKLIMKKISSSEENSMHSKEISKDTERDGETSELHINPQSNWIVKKRDFMKLKNLKNRTTIIENCPNTMDEELLNNLKKEEIKEKNAKKAFNFNILNMMKIIFCNCRLNHDEKNKSNIYNFVLDFIIEKLDLISYIKLNSRFEKLLLLHYNDYQHFSFDFLKKPNLLDKKELEIFDIDFDYNCNDSDTIDTTKTGKKMKSEKLTLSLLKYYIAKLKENKLESTDEKLFDMLDNKFKKVVIENAIVLNKSEKSE